MRQITVLATVLLIAAGCAGSGSGDDAGMDAGTDAGTDTGTGSTSPESEPMPSDGCTMDTQIAPGLTDQSIEVDGEERTYVLQLPERYDSSRPYPLIFGFHGRGTSARIFQPYFDVDNAAGNAAIFVYPNGLPQGSEEQTSWDRSEDGVDVALFDALLAELSSSLCIDRNRVFATGHSAGGFMTNALGCLRGETLRAIAPVASGGPFAEPCTGPVAAWIAHGELDEVVEFSLGEESRDFWAGANGCGNQTTPLQEPAECSEYQGCEARDPVVWCPHQEETFSGHHWPSFAGAGIWQFFSRF